MTRFRSTLLALALAGSGFSASCSSNTSKQITSFTDKICKCADAACATAVQAEYLQWWKDNQRARGSEGDRKDIEKAMQRYAECHLRLVGPAAESPPVRVPHVDLTRPAPNGESPAPLPVDDVVPSSGDEAPRSGDESPASGMDVAPPASADSAAKGIPAVP